MRIVTIRSHPRRILFSKRDSLTWGLEEEEAILEAEGQGAAVEEVEVVEEKLLATMGQVAASMLLV